MGCLTVKINEVSQLGMYKEHWHPLWSLIFLKPGTQSSNLTVLNCKNLAGVKKTRELVLAFSLAQVVAITATHDGSRHTIFRRATLLGKHAEHFKRKKEGVQQEQKKTQGRQCQALFHATRFEENLLLLQVYILTATTSPRKQVGPLDELHSFFTLERTMFELATSCWVSFWITPSPCVA